MIDCKRTLQRLAIAGLALGALAACTPENGNSPTASSTPDGSSSGPSATVSGGSCVAQQNGLLYVGVGQSTLKVQTSSIEDLIPTGIEGPLNVEKLQTAVQSKLDAGFGCQGKPIEASVLVLRTEPTDPRLDGLLIIKNSPPKKVIDASVRLTKELQSNPGGKCQAVGDKLIRCIGTARQGEITKQIMYAVSTDRSQKMRSGGPLAANCVAVKDGAPDCRIIDHLGGDLSFEARIKPGKYDSAALKSAWSAVISGIDSLRG